MGNDAIHSSVISDVTVYKRSNQCSSQLSVSNYQVFKSSNLQMFLKFLKIDRISLVYQSFYFILFRNVTMWQQNFFPVNTNSNVHSTKNYLNKLFKIHIKQQNANNKASPISEGTRLWDAKGQQELLSADTSSLCITLSYLYK